ncbi:putative surface protein with fasciclin (FAS1) repeats [Sphingomonas kaistensis]|uniref:Putative surface protein with fasciclin (FAS1) repeats n=1 Tax=Sphingomonas kaistensis TaxID=298708 RepID=A0A7X5Y577_9SPHN|nr:fasciclin domain-containing protein [Sphingomonas kaistensis]NJC05413.1 putative surface protein with fasciclin (FAS1) repeats [Sphingomonas kaistensis]
MRTPTFFAALAGLTLAATPAAALDHHSTMPGKTVVEVAVGNPDFSTLVAAVKAADLATTLSGKGPFTVFAPTNAAFAKLPAGTVETLVQPANKATLTSILTYHVVAGRVNAAQLTKLIKDGGGTATLTTVQGGTLKASLMGSRIMLTDAKGGMSHVVTANINASNGVIHAIDTVVMP